MSSKLVANSVTYSTENKNLLEDFSLEFVEGCLHGVLGPNGSGKSTLLKTLSGIWRPSSGDILWKGESLLHKERQAISRLISLVPQSLLPAFDFLVQDMVAMGRYPYQSNYWEATESPVVQEAMRLVDVWHLRHRLVTQLSHGERQRVYIARALASEAPILLLDEPTASLDVRHEIEIWQLLETFAAQGKVIIVSTHNLALAERYCQQIAVLNRGRCVGSGLFSDLMTPTLLQEVFGIIEISHNIRPYHQEFGV